MGGLCCCYSEQKFEDSHDALEYAQIIDSEIYNLTMILDTERKYREITRLINSLKKDLLMLKINGGNDIVKIELETKIKILRSL
jgi:hypothetical protein